jgi:hypothetical protein
VKEFAQSPGCAEKLGFAALDRRLGASWFGMSVDLKIASPRLTPEKLA